MRNVAETGISLAGYQARRDAQWAEEAAERDRLAAQDLKEDLVRHQARRNKHTAWAIQEGSDRYDVPMWAYRQGQSRVAAIQAAEDSAVREKRTVREAELRKARTQRDMANLYHDLGIQPTENAELDNIRILGAELRQVRAREQQGMPLHTDAGRADSLKVQISDRAAHYRGKRRQGKTKVAA